MKKLSLIAALVLISVSQSAQAGVGLLGGASFHSISFDNGGSTQTYNTSSHVGFIGGLAFSSNFMLLNLEIDALYDNRTLNLPFGTSASSPAIQVPVMARFGIIPAILDIGVGPYASFNVGNNNLVYKSPDFGAVGSVRLMLPTPGIHLVLDGRYNFGFTNLANSSIVTNHTREFQLMAGIDLPFGNSTSSN